MDNELYHYGVKGMKWGVRKKVGDAYKKSMRNLGGTKFSKNAILKSKHLDDNGKRQALADNAYLAAKKKAKRINGDITYDVTTKKYNVQKRDKRSDWSEDARTAHDIKQKSVNQMSNAELKKANERTRLEQEYSRLNPNTVQAGWKYVAAGAATAGTLVGLYNNSQTLIKAGKNIADKLHR